MNCACPQITRIVIDPARNRTKPGVIETIVAAKVERVLHIFCSMEIMPKELEFWNRAEHKVQRAVPFDMFSGTGEIEMKVRWYAKTLQLSPRYASRTTTILDKVVPP